MSRPHGCFPGFANLKMDTDAELMSSLVGGDQSALASLYERHCKVLYSVALRICGDSGSAEELLQDTFFQLWLKASQFNSSRGSLIGWLLTMTRHRAIDRIRRNENRYYRESLWEDTFCPSPNGSTILDQQIAHQLVSVALQALPKVQRDAITFAYFEGLTCEEIAVRTRTPLGTIKWRLRKALKAMRARLSHSMPSATPAPACTRVTLESVLITEQLAFRICRQRESQIADCRQILQETAIISPEQLIDCFLNMALDICHAGTAGVSLLETTASGKQQFRWTNLTGKLANCVGGTTPRDFSPCGITLDRNSPQLFLYPGRYFKYFNQVASPIVEGLVIPFHIGTHTEGTIWIVSHDQETRFDFEDARIMTSLAEFTGCAIHLGKSADSKER